MPQTTLIEAQSLVRDYGGVRAVDGVSFYLRRGEVLGILGANGAGKSTTLQMVCGVLAPGSGSIEICGHDLDSAPLAARACIGYLPEQPPLYPDLRVDEYLAYCARLHRVPRQAVGQALARVKHQCGLEQVGRRRIGNLSKGYQQRVGIAQALVHRPPVVVLDEPTVGLDPNQIREIRELIRGLGSEHGVVLSTHILPEVQQICDRVLILHRGRVVLDRPLAMLGGEGPARLRLQLRRPPSPEALRVIEGVRTVEPLKEGGFRVTGDDEEVAGRLAEAAVAGGWGLTALCPEQTSLEERFVELTLREEEPA